MNSENKNPFANIYTRLSPSRFGWHLGLSNDAFQTGAIMHQGEWAPMETNILLSLINPGNTVLDVGANVGSMTMAFASAVRSKGSMPGSVFAFEPQRFPHACLCANIALNSLIHFVHPLRVAVGDKDGEIEVPILDPCKVNNFGGCSLLDPHESITELVPLITIDSMELPFCHLIKADVEGMEPGVLRGAQKTISKHRPVLWFELLTERTRNRPETRADLVSITQGHGYRAWEICTPLDGPNAKGMRDPIFFTPSGEPMGDCNILAIPDESPIPTWISESNSKPFA